MQLPKMHETIFSIHVMGVNFDVDPSHKLNGRQEKYDLSLFVTIPFEYISNSLAKETKMESRIWCGAVCPLISTNLWYKLLSRYVLSSNMDHQTPHIYIYIYTLCKFWTYAFIASYDSITLPKVSVSRDTFRYSLTIFPFHLSTSKN